MIKIKNKLKLGLLALTITLGLFACAGNEDSNNAADFSDRRAGWMAGNWGVTHRVDGGYKLDKSAGSSDWQAGAEEIVKNIPNASYVITSFTHPAHAYLFTLRTNNNLDVSDIHADMVPTLENEQIILDVINIYRKAGKKVILYLNLGGPSMAASRNDPDIQTAWESYYKSQWNGDEGAAWRNLVQGYAQRFDGLVDGYWLDNARSLPGEISDFVKMLRSIDPTLAIAVNNSKNYFTDDHGDYLYVDSDGLYDENETDYKIVKHVVTNEYMDFTNGHITPLGQGAPPNSWAYEEYTIPHMIETPWAVYEGEGYEGENYGLKHGWFPIRDYWSGSSAELMFDVEQAYRFVRTITDGGAAMTWSTTQKRGYMSDDEMDIMIEINDRMTQSPKADYIKYERPVDAYLVGE